MIELTICFWVSAAIGIAHVDRYHGRLAAALILIYLLSTVGYPVLQDSMKRPHPYPSDPPTDAS